MGGICIGPIAGGQISDEMAEAGLMKNSIESILKDVWPEVSGTVCW